MGIFFFCDNVSLLFPRGGRWGKERLILAQTDRGPQIPAVIGTCRVLCQGEGLQPRLQEWPPSGVSGAQHVWPW